MITIVTMIPIVWIVIVWIVRVRVIWIIVGIVISPIVSWTYTHGHLSLIIIRRAITTARIKIITSGKIILSPAFYISWHVFAPNDIISAH
jgi:hypothetical protein